MARSGWQPPPAAGRPLWWIYPQQTHSQSPALFDVRGIDSNISTKEIPMTQQPPPQSPLPPEGTPPEGAQPEGNQPEGTQPEGTRQQPPPQSPWSQPSPGDASQHTAPLWYEQTQTQMQPPAYSPVVPQTPAEHSTAALTQRGAKHTASGKTRRLAEASAIALVAAVLASAGTYGLTRTDAGSAPAAQTSASATTS